MESSWRGCHTKFLSLCKAKGNRSRCWMKFRCALYYLFAILNEEIVRDLLDVINNYAADLCAKNRPVRRYSVFQNFTHISYNEFLRFLACCWLWRNIKCFWSHVDHEYTPWYSKIMPRKRFEALFHCSVPFSTQLEQTQCSEKKIKPFLNKLTKSFQAVYYPDKQVSIDEVVIVYHGRWKYKQFNTFKPSKYHIKTFGLCDSQTGYEINIFTYYGSEQATTLTSTQNQPKQSVFEKPLRPLDKRHHIFTDRFYTSMPLLKYLKTRRFYYTDTVDVCRKDFPPEIKTRKLDFFQIKWYLS